MHKTSKQMNTSSALSASMHEGSGLDASMNELNVGIQVSMILKVHSTPSMAWIGEEHLSMPSNAGSWVLGNVHAIYQHIY
jgi:hypothetical protein